VHQGRDSIEVKMLPGVLRKTPLVMQVWHALAGCWIAQPSSAGIFDLCMGGHLMHSLQWGSPIFVPIFLHWQ
jgi:hypothetical protein